MPRQHPMVGKRAPFIALPDANGNLYELPLGQKVIPVYPCSPGLDRRGLSREFEFIGLTLGVVVLGLRGIGYRVVCLSDERESSVYERSKSWPGSSS
jgi:hypothetical protein